MAACRRGHRGAQTRHAKKRWLIAFATEVPKQEMFGKAMEKAITPSINDEVAALQNQAGVHEPDSAPGDISDLVDGDDDDFDEDDADFDEDEP